MATRKTRSGTGRGLALAALTAVALATAAVVGCKNAGDADGATATSNAPAANGATPIGDLWRVTADSTSFYRFGPQQPSGPDLALKKDTRVTMLKRSFGYSQVQTADKQVGYVGTSDLQPLSAEELKSEQAAQAAAAGPKHDPNRRSPAIVGEYTIPAGAGSAEKLPEPENKPPPNPAMFRY